MREQHASVEWTILKSRLNEVDTFATPIGKTRDFLDRTGTNGEILIADDGSNHGSQQVAAEDCDDYLGARQKTLADVL